jgi:hypothetical protein
MVANVVSGAAAMPLMTGAVPSTVHVRAAGVGSAPEALTARAWNVCDPSARLEYVTGVEQAANAAPSIEHWNVVPVSVEVNWNVALRVVTMPEGPAVIVVSGAPSATVHVLVAGVASGPVTPIALTVNVCDPLESAEYVTGLTQLVAAAPSSEHWNVVPVSVDVNWKVALCDDEVPDGPLVMIVSGTGTS